MGYITPITDRTTTDIEQRNDKAFWSVEDWQRVYGNTLLVSALAAIAMDKAIAFTSLTAPTITTIPAVEDFNAFVHNIESLRVAVAPAHIPGTDVPIKDDYIAGPGQVAPDYVAANLWESTLDAIWVHFDGDSLTVCPILSNNLILATDTQEVYVDCIDADVYDVELQGTAKLYII